MRLSSVAIIRSYQIFILFLVSYGILYFSYKYYTPEQGGNDFFEYYQMYLNPLDFSQARAPFIYRQVSAVLTHLVYAAGIHYPNEIAFNNSNYSQQLFFSALFSNYIALLLTAIFVGLTIYKTKKSRSFLAPIFGGMLCFLAFMVQQTVITGLTEGWSWFLVILCFFGYQMKNFSIVAFALILSLFQRETIPVAFGVIASIDWLIRPDPSKQKQFFYLKVLICSLLVSVGYIILRKVLIPIEGHNYQLSLSNSIANLLDCFPPSKQLIMQGALSQNIYFVFLGAVLTILVLRYQSSPKQFWKGYLVSTLKATGFFQLTCALIVLDIIGLAAGIGNNIGRIGSVLTPIAATLSVLNILEIEDLLSSARTKITGNQISTTDN